LLLLLIWKIGKRKILIKNKIKIPALKRLQKYSKQSHDLEYYFLDALTDLKHRYFGFMA
jgi:hypothetical protein